MRRNLPPERVIRNGFAGRDDDMAMMRLYDPVKCASWKCFHNVL